MNPLVAVLTVALVLLSQTPDTLAVDLPTEEFNGPFASWRQVQCTGQDDTGLLQAELNTLGRAGSPVLYIAPSTCRITATLKLEGAQYVTLLGHDPSDTRIAYAGPAGRPMLQLNGVG